MASSKRKKDADSSGASKKGRGAEAQEETSPLRFKAGDRVMVKYGKSGKRKRRQPATIKAASATTRKYSVIWDSTGDRTNDIAESDILEMTADEKRKHGDEGTEDKENEAPTENEETAEPQAESQRDNPEDVGDNPEDVGDDANDATGGERPKLVDETETGYEGQGGWVSDLGEHPDTDALNEKWKDEGVTLEERERRIELIDENEVERGVIRRANCMAKILLERMQEEKKVVEETFAAEHGEAMTRALESIALGRQNLEQWKKMPKDPEEDAVVASLEAAIEKHEDVHDEILDKCLEEEKKLADKFERDFRAKMARHHVSQGEMLQKVKDGIERLKASNTFRINMKIEDEEVDEPLDEP